MMEIDSAAVSPEAAAAAELPANGSTVPGGNDVIAEDAQDGDITMMDAEDLPAGSPSVSASAAAGAPAPSSNSPAHLVAAAGSNAQPSTAVADHHPQHEASEGQHTHILLPQHKAGGDAATVLGLAKGPPVVPTQDKLPTASAGQPAQMKASGSDGGGEPEAKAVPEWASEGALAPPAAQPTGAALEAAAAEPVLGAVGAPEEALSSAAAGGPDEPNNATPEREGRAVDKGIVHGHGPDQADGQHEHDA
jgi:hypothetical protein